MSNPNPTAFPHPSYRDTWTLEPMDERQVPASNGMTLRDYFATHLTPDTQAMDALSDADDQDLLQTYGTPEEIEEGFSYISPGSPMTLWNIELRASLEARGRAKLRWLEADAMLSSRSV